MMVEWEIFGEELAIGSPSPRNWVSLRNPISSPCQVDIASIAQKSP
jgi:hypothetical protein